MVQIIFSTPHKSTLYEMHHLSRWPRDLVIALKRLTQMQMAADRQLEDEMAPKRRTDNFFSRFVLFQWNNQIRGALVKFVQREPFVE